MEDMQARAKVSYARISPRKVSVVLDLIRKQPLDKALGILQNKRDTNPMKKHGNIPL